MKCPRCGSSDVSVQAVNEWDMVDDKKRHGILWWLVIGWWWAPLWFCFKWLVLTVPALIIAVVRRAFGLRPKRVVNRTVSKAVCQTCGHVWTPRN